MCVWTQLTVARAIRGAAMLSLYIYIYSCTAASLVYIVAVVVISLCAHRERKIHWESRQTFFRAHQLRRIVAAAHTHTADCIYRGSFILQKEMRKNFKGYNMHDITRTSLSSWRDAGLFVAFSNWTRPRALLRLSDILSLFLSKLDLAFVRQNQLVFN